jgi:hypothetical protein
MPRYQRLAVIVVGLVLLPATTAYAQGSIAGVVKDPSGGVLPGVTVEASSPALIERFARSSLTEPANTRSLTCGQARTPSRSG